MSTTSRKPAVAGIFYPSAKDDLKRQLDKLIVEGEEQYELLACVAPHAGYRYSGRVAGRVYGQLQVPRRVLVMGPNHTGMGAAFAISPHEEWQTPLGPVPVDRELGQKLLDEVPGAELDSSAHWREHSIEVQLPFLKARQPKLVFLPVCVKHLSLDDCLKLGEVIARLVEQADEPLGLVASSDMTHYEPDEVARTRDRKAIDAALTLDPTALYDTVHQNGITMCGVIPATVVLAAAARLGATRAELVSYETSGDISGDRSAVVGYAGIRIDREH